MNQPVKDPTRVVPQDNRQVYFIKGVVIGSTHFTVYRSEKRLGAPVHVYINGFYLKTCSQAEANRIQESMENGDYDGR